jgi:arabinosaccharide transport system substrate-binding protein
MTSTSPEHQPRHSRASTDGALSRGAWAIVLIAICSTFAMALAPSSRTDAQVYWTFARLHKQLYDPIVAKWNVEHPPGVAMTLLSIPALERRMMSAFLSGTPSSDYMEIERRMASRAFGGPADSIGFVDLTDRLKAEGLYDEINTPSYGPWSSRGRVYGLPHDVHPVLLAYRADLVEPAGIDVSKIETWSDFEREMAPLMTEKDADGNPVRYLLSLWETSADQIEMLILQAGGGYFDDAGSPIIASDTNARVLAQMVTWCHGPNRIAAEAPDFSQSGNRLRNDGFVVASFMPDWMCNIWKNEIPTLKGKVKVMPIPAWDRGGRRTSVWGGTMLGIPSASAGTPEAFESRWAFAKQLYLSPELARETYRAGDIITPVKKYWSDPIFDEPDPYFAGQAKARMYIAQAPSVPRRTSSPFNLMANQRVQNAVVALGEYARRTSTFGDPLRAEAKRQLQAAEADVRAQMDRNVFLRPALAPAEKRGRP